MEQRYEDYATLFDIVGEEKAMKILDEFGGQSIYIPVKKNVLRPERDKEICKEYKGHNVRELARKHCLTPSGIKAIVKAGKESPG